MQKKNITVRFFRTASGNEPVRAFLLNLDEKDRHKVGVALKDIEFGWPVGMPTCRPITSEKGLYEVRENISDGRTIRIMFCQHDTEMVLLHAFIKKTQKTPKTDLDLARQRMRHLE